MESKAKSTIMTRLEEMKALATEEAVKLKGHAKKRELKNLDSKYFNPEYPSTCIYGLITGNCFNHRASELIGKCAPKMYVLKEDTKMKSAELNGSPKQVDLERRRTLHYSPIETLIFNEWGGKDLGEKIIAFLKDETKTLEL